MEISRCARCSEPLLIGGDNTGFLEDGTALHEWCLEETAKEDAHWTQEENGVETAREEGKL